MVRYVKATWIIAAAVLGSLPGRAGASPLADALVRHAPADVTALRAQLAAAPAEVAVRCTLGAVYAARADLPRAALHLTGCDDAALPADLAPAITRAVRETRTRLRASELSELQILTDPAGTPVEVSALPGEPLTGPVTVWVPAGTYTVRATRANGAIVEATITTRPYSRAMVPIDARVTAPAPTRTGQVDFSDDNATESSAGPPPDIKRPSLMSDKQRGIAGPRTGPELEDPLPLRTRRGARPWLGVRLGGGVFDDAHATASVRPSVAAVARIPLAPRLFLAARLDWSRRGGAAPAGNDGAIDTAGVAVGVGTPVLAGRRAQLAVLGQLRGDLRFADVRAMTPVRGAGLALAVGLEVALAGTPLTAGVRLEQGLTELVAGARDRAVVVELGVDWR